MPEEPIERARARIWMDYCTNKYLVLSRKLLVDNGNEALQIENKKKIKDSLIYIERECFEKNVDGPFWSYLVSNGLRSAQKFRIGGKQFKKETVIK